MLKMWGRFLLEAGLLWAVAAAQAQSAGLVPVAGQSPAANKATISISITATQDVVKAGSPVFLDMTITNMSSHQVELGVFGRAWVREVEVRDSQGNQSLTREGRILFKHEAATSKDVITSMWGLGSESSSPLDPGKARVFHRQVPALFDLSQPGKYTIQVHRIDGPGVVVNSNTVTVTVVP